MIKELHIGSGDGDGVLAVGQALCLDHGNLIQGVLLIGSGDPLAVSVLGVAVVGIDHHVLHRVTALVHDLHSQSAGGVAGHGDDVETGAVEGELCGGVLTGGYVDHGGGAQGVLAHGGVSCIVAIVVVGVDGIRDLALTGTILLLGCVGSGTDGDPTLVLRIGSRSGTIVVFLLYGVGVGLQLHELILVVDGGCGDHGDGGVHVDGLQDVILVVACLGLIVEHGGIGKLHAVVLVQGESDGGQALHGGSAHQLVVHIHIRGLCLGCAVLAAVHGDTLGSVCTDAHNLALQSIVGGNVDDHIQTVVHNHGVGCQVCGPDNGESDGGVGEVEAGEDIIGSIAAGSGVLDACLGVEDLGGVLAGYIHLFSRDNEVVAQILTGLVLEDIDGVAGAGIVQGVDLGQQFCCDLFSGQSLVLIGIPGDGLGVHVGDVDGLSEGNDAACTVDGLTLGIDQIEGVGNLSAVPGQLGLGEFLLALVIQVVGIGDGGVFVGGVGTCFGLIFGIITGRVLQIQVVAQCQLGGIQLISLPGDDMGGSVVGEVVGDDGNDIAVGVLGDLLAVQSNGLDDHGLAGTVLVRIQGVLQHIDGQGSAVRQRHVFGSFQNQGVLVSDLVGDGDIGGSFLDGIDDVLENGNQLVCALIGADELGIIAVGGRVIVCVAGAVAADLLQNSVGVAVGQLDTDGVDLHAGITHLLGVVLGVGVVHVSSTVGVVTVVAVVLHAAVGSLISEAGGGLAVSNEDHELLAVRILFLGCFQDTVALLQSSAVVGTGAGIVILNPAGDAGLGIGQIGGVVLVAGILIAPQGENFMNCVGIILRGRTAIITIKGIHSNTVVVDGAVLVFDDSFQCVDSGLSCRLNTADIVVLHGVGHIDHDDNVDLIAHGVGNAGHGQLHLGNTGIGEVANSDSILVDTDSTLVGVLGEVVGAVGGGEVQALGHGHVQGVHMLLTIGIGIGGGDGDNALGAGKGQLAVGTDAGNGLVGDSPGDIGISNLFNVLGGLLEGHQCIQIQAGVDSFLALDRVGAVQRILLGIHDLQLVTSRLSSDDDLAPDHILAQGVGGTDGGGAALAGEGHLAVGIHSGNRLIAGRPGIGAACGVFLIALVIRSNSSSQIQSGLVGDILGSVSAGSAVGSGNTDTVSNVGNGGSGAVSLVLVQVHILLGRTDRPTISGTIVEVFSATGFIIGVQDIVAIRPGIILTIHHKVRTAVNTQILSVIGQGNTLGSGPNSGCIIQDNERTIVTNEDINVHLADGTIVIGQGNAAAGSNIDDQILATGSQRVHSHVDILCVGFSAAGDSQGTILVGLSLALLSDVLILHIGSGGLTLSGSGSLPDGSGGLADGSGGLLSRSGGLLSRSGGLLGRSLHSVRGGCLLGGRALSRSGSGGLLSRSGSLLSGSSGLADGSGGLANGSCSLTLCLRSKCAHRHQAQEQHCAQDQGGKTLCVA